MHRKKDHHGEKRTEAEMGYFCGLKPHEGLNRPACKVIEWFQGRCEKSTTYAKRRGGGKESKKS